MGLAGEGRESEGFLRRQAVTQHSQLCTEKEKHQLNFKTKVVHIISSCIIMYFNLKSIGILSVYPKFKKLLDLALAGGINGMITISSSSCENGIEISKYVYFLF